MVINLARRLSHLWGQSPCICCSSPLLRSDRRERILAWNRARPSCWRFGRSAAPQGGTSGGRIALGCPESSAAARWGRTWQDSGIRKNKIKNEMHIYFWTSIFLFNNSSGFLCIYATGNHWKPWDASEFVSYGNKRHTDWTIDFEKRRDVCLWGEGGSRQKAYTS